MGSRKFARFLLSLLVVSLLSAGSLMALDIYVEQETKSGGMREVPSTEGIQRIWIAKDMIRTEDAETQQVMIVRLDKNIMWMIDLNRKVYQEITIDQFKQMMGMMRAGHGGIMRGGREEGEVEVKETGNRMKIKGWNCYEVLITVRGRASMEISMWLTRDVEVPWEEYEKFMEVFGIQMYSPEVIERWKSLRGYPIRSHTQVGTMEFVNEVITLKTSPIPKAVFELPPGLTREEISIPRMPH
jgi:hypothetical protein